MAGIGPKTERGVGGFSSLYKDNRKKVVVKYYSEKGSLSSLIESLLKVVASAANYRCQKCLEVGHWTYDCTGTRK